MNTLDYKKLYLELLEEKSKLKLDLDKKDKILQLIDKEFEYQLSTISDYSYQNPTETFNWGYQLYKKIQSYKN